MDRRIAEARRVAARGGDPSLLHALLNRSGLCKRCELPRPKVGIDAHGHWACLVCSALEEHDALERATKKYSGYVAAPIGPADLPFVTTFTSYPLVKITGPAMNCYALSHSGSRARCHWRGNDIWGRLWWGVNSGPGMFTNMKLYKGAGMGETGAQFVDRTQGHMSPEARRARIQGLHLRRMQLEWLAQSERILGGDRPPSGVETCPRCGTEGEHPHVVLLPTGEIVCDACHRA